MKIIVVGCGKVGITLAEQLTAERHDVTVVDISATKLRAIADRLDLMCLEGSGVSSETLREAGVKDADLLIATTDTDEKNVLICLIAKKLGNCQTIARITNPEYIKDIRLIKDELNLAMVLNPDYAAASEILRLVKFPSAMEIDTFAKGRVEMLKLTIPKDSILHDCRIRDLSSKVHCNVLVCAVERDGEVIIPDGNFILKEGDLISFVGQHRQALSFVREMGLLTDGIRSVMIIGGSKIAMYLAKALEDMGISVKIIERDYDRCMFLSNQLDKSIIINGDGSDRQLLMEEGVEEVDAVATLTGFDEENIMISLYVGSVSKAKVITKINRITFEDVINGLNLGSVVNPKIISAERITRYVRGMQNSLGSNIETLYKIASGKAEALEFRVREGSESVGIPLMDLKLKKNLLIACINRQGNIIIPGGHDRIEIGDTVIVATAETGLNDLKDIFE